MSFRTRFAPSPTGYLHVGGARTALYCWLQAKKEGGDYVLRIEDTDRERSTDAAVEAILTSLDWLGLNADDEPVFQTSRFDRYHEVIEQLLEQGDAYPCYCSVEELDAMREEQKAAKQKPRYDGRCRHRTEFPDDVPSVIRFKTPLEGMTQFDDDIRGRITVQNAELDDLIIRRSDGSPTYNLTVVVDDMDMHISHVIRGDDHINNTPRQINIFNALGATPPAFAHVPMILGADGSRLSKRHGAVSVMEYQKQGILPEALLNYLVRLGWSHGDQELFSVEEMQALFDVSDVNKAASSFNHEKLLWINQQHMLKTDPGRLAELVGDYYASNGIEIADASSLVSAVTAYRERTSTVNELAEACLYLFQEFDDYDAGAAKKHLRPVAQEALELLRTRFSELQDWNQPELAQLVQGVLEELQLKMPKVAQPLRVTLTGASSSPSIDVVLELVGKATTLNRLERAIKFIEARKAA